jgi:hypothetical protein
MAMDKMISVCGLVCTTCPAFEATRDNDDAKRKATSEQWSKAFGSTVKPEDVNCFGCLTTKGKVFSYCQVCEIRKCGMGKGVKNCAYCADYACDKLLKFFEMAPQAKQNLEEVRKSKQ